MLSTDGPKPEELTFKTRVDRFWQWFESVAARYYQLYEAQNSDDVYAETTDKMDELFPGFAWVYGPGEAGIGEPGRSFTISGDGIFQKQLLTLYWAGRAPRLEGWTFYASRQPSPPEIINGMTMTFEGQELKPIEFWLTPAVDHEAEKVNLTVWHPLYAGVAEDEVRLQPFFLFLDEVLGEYGTDHWIGQVTTGEKQLADSIPLTELHAYIEKLETETGWQKLLPGESHVEYEREEPKQRFPRDDVFVGSTMLFDLIRDYEDAEGNMEDPLEGTGADYVFVSTDAKWLRQGEEMEKRDAVENALEAALKAEHSGRVLGEAFGTQFGYVDLMVFDGRNSIQIIERVLREQNAPAGTAINYFAQEKNSERVVL